MLKMFVTKVLVPQILVPLSTGENSVVGTKLGPQGFIAWPTRVAAQEREARLTDKTMEDVGIPKTSVLLLQPLRFGATFFGSIPFIFYFLFFFEDVTGKKIWTQIGTRYVHHFCRRAVNWWLSASTAMSYNVPPRG